MLALRHPTDNGTSAGSATPPPVKSSSSSKGAKASKSPSKSPSGSSSSPAPSTSSTSETAAAKTTPLVVLNDTSVYHLASQAGAQFAAGGWTVTSSGNYDAPDGILSTCAYYDPAVSGAEADAQALKAQFPGIARVEPKFADLPAGPIVVVLTPGYNP
ncbi:MAG: LytR cell envelope-related transcriptional attenuator [Jatrophihabitans sp.]|nr:LytR cell envelope-related transcriptional attenuator [Jatrophihabitans sp.]